MRRVGSRDSVLKSWSARAAWRGYCSRTRRHWHARVRLGRLRLVAVRLGHMRRRHPRHPGIPCRRILWQILGIDILQDM
jgi:hypothetical protein